MCSRISLVGAGVVDGREGGARLWPDAVRSRPRRVRQCTLDGLERVCVASVRGKTEFIWWGETEFIWRWGREISKEKNCEGGEYLPPRTSRMGGRASREDL